MICGGSAPNCCIGQPSWSCGGRNCLFEEVTGFTADGWCEYFFFFRQKEKNHSVSVVDIPAEQEHLRILAPFGCTLDLGTQQACGFCTKIMTSGRTWRPCWSHFLKSSLYHSLAWQHLAAKFRQCMGSYLADEKSQIKSRIPRWILSKRHSFTHLPETRRSLTFNSFLDFFQLDGPLYIGESHGPVDFFGLYIGCL